MQHTVMVCVQMQRVQQNKLNAHGVVSTLNCLVRRAEQRDDMHADGIPLRPALLWMDMRSAKQAAQVAACGDPALKVGRGVRLPTSKALCLSWFGPYPLTQLPTVFPDAISCYCSTTAVQPHDTLSMATSN